MTEQSKKLFISTLRIFMYVESEVDAVLTTDEIVEEIEEHLDPEDGDRVEATQLTEFSSDVEPTETMNILLRARNALIRTRIKQCFDLAQQMDKVIHALKHRDDGSGMVMPYNYGDFMQVAYQILDSGEDPL